MQTSRLKLFDLTMIVISLVIGMGIFRTASDAAKASLNPAIFFGVWLAGGLVALCGALTYAEIGSRYPVTGGYYKIFSYAYHPSIAFALNCSILISNAASTSGVALIGAGYLSRVLFPEAPVYVLQIIAVTAILLFYLINLAGLRMSATAQNILMSIKIGMLLLIVASIFFPHAYAVDNTPLFNPTASSGSALITSFGLGMVAVSFSYGGYQQTINFGQDVEAPSRNIPKGIFRGITLIIVLYLIVNFAYYKIVGFEQMKTTTDIAAIVAERLLGTQGGRIFSMLLVIAVFGYVNVILLSNPRVMYAMSQDGILPEAFQNTWKTRGVFYVSLSVFVIITLIIIFFAKTFDNILKFSIFLDSFGMVASAATIFIMRRRKLQPPGGSFYTMKFYPALPLLFMLAYIFVCVNIAIADPTMALIGIAVMAAFIALFLLVRRRKNS